MAMVEKAFVYDDLQTAEQFEERRLRVLNGTAAKEAVNTHRADAVKVILTLMAVFVYMLVSALLEGQIGSVGVEINNVKAQIADVQNQTVRTEMAISNQSSLAWVEEYAQNQLGMVTPGPQDIYYLNAETSAAIAQSQTGQSAAAAAEPTVENGFLTAIAAALSSFFNRPAVAAGED